MLIDSNILKNHILQNISFSDGTVGKYYSLSALEKYTCAPISRLPISIRIILESALRGFDNKKVNSDHINLLIKWQQLQNKDKEIPFIPSRIVLQDYTGVPLLADLAAMRETAYQAGFKPDIVEPLVPVSLVIDHSVQTNVSQHKDALKLNMELEFRRNQERYEFMKWGSQAFRNLQIMPPGVGIVHQVNLEYLAKGIFENKSIFYPDTVVGTDSHTTMINGLGVVGWGVGGIEAEACLLGQPIYIPIPEVIGINIKGFIKEGVTITDVVLTITELLRKTKVVGKIIEFYGEGVNTFSAQDRSTIANMAPDYGALMGFFPIDNITLDYYTQTGRHQAHVKKIYEYYKLQNMFGIPVSGEIDYSACIEFDLSSVEPCVSGPRRPQDRISLSDVKEKFELTLTSSSLENGYNLQISQLEESFSSENDITVRHGDILIASITSCTNTSNPNVLIAAGILAKNAVEKGLKVAKHIKTSLTPGSRVVETYLKKAGLLQHLETLGFNIVAFGCATCVGNVGELNPTVEEIVLKNNLIVTSVLSGNRNFEARIHPHIRANFLMSPPLVVAFALAGTIRINFDDEPIGYGNDNMPVFLKDIWPTQQKINELFKETNNSKNYSESYSNLETINSFWNDIHVKNTAIYNWNEQSTYIAKPPFLDDFTVENVEIQDICNARSLIILGDSITTDHISPAGSIPPTSPASIYLQSRNVNTKDFNSFGARRGHHEVMLRGTFCNVRIKNIMFKDKNIEGGFTIHYPSEKQMTIYDAGMKYIQENVPTIIFAGEEYGTGSSRDWAAKGTKLLGVRAVVARSFERIHKTNLIHLGILPCQFRPGEDTNTLGINGDELFDLIGLDNLYKNKEVILKIHRANGTEDEFPLILRLDTEIEVDYFKCGGILPYVLKEMLSSNASLTSNSLKYESYSEI